MFTGFLESIKTNENKLLIEGISRAFSVCFESSNAPGIYQEIVNKVKKSQEDAEIGRDDTPRAFPFSLDGTTSNRLFTNMNKDKLFRNFLDSMYRYDPVLIDVIQEGINLLNESESPSESPVDLQYKKERLRSHPFISKLINSRDLYDEYRRISHIFDNATNLTADEFHKLLSFFDGNEEIFSGIDYGIYTERMKLKENVRSIVYDITTKIKQYFDEYYTSKLQNNDTYLYLKGLYDEYKDNPNLDHFLR